MPILAGPGTIASTMNFAANPGSGQIGITIAMFALLCLVTYVFFKYSESIVAYLGQRGLKIITRLMGLILAVIGIVFVVLLILELVGVTDIFKSI